MQCCFPSRKAKRFTADMGVSVGCGVVAASGDRYEVPCTGMLDSNLHVGQSQDVMLFSG